MSQITTSITIQFGDGSAQSGSLSAEIDNRSDGLNGGRSQFAPDEVVWFLVYPGPNVQYSPPILSDGELLQGSEVNVPQEETLTFANSRETRLAKPAIAMPALTWFGTALGAATLGADGSTITCANAGVAVAKAAYQSRAYSWGIKAPRTSGGSKVYSIAVYIEGNLRA
ncbi:hypothetical protein [Chitinibacter sp. GC72]|uniref:hypothetical protein n=1 Tax=Chitinibacter sp. GC72 TaxID=1526917 RepID=UPI0012F70F32|nr:hypothetical protein [Chitinibacter sp. GC72]